MAKEFLQATNYHGEPNGPNKGAIILTCTIGRATVRIETSDWVTELTFEKGQSSMWIYPPKSDDFSISKHQVDMLRKAAAPDRFHELVGRSLLKE